MKKYFKLKNYVNAFRNLVRGRYRRSYSQQGEDLLIQLALRTLSISNPTYLDIGANDPILSNNTYLLYTQGYRGVCIEPDPRIFKAILQKRKRDVCLNIGVGPVDDPHAKYYVLNANQSSTFNKEDVDNYATNPAYKDLRLLEVLTISLVSTNSIMEQYFANGLDLMSIDTEGYDLAILQSLDFGRFQPKIICVETLRQDENGKLHKIEEIYNLLTSKGYTVFADTQVNTIFTLPVKA